MNVRDYIKDELAPLCPTTWAWIPAQRMPDTIARPTVVIKHNRLEPLEAAPLGHLRATVTLSVFDPHTDVDSAEDALDDAVIDLVTAIDTHAQIHWSAAEKVVSENNTYFGWDLTLSVVTTKQEEEA